MLMSAASTTEAVSKIVSTLRDPTNAHVNKDTTSGLITLLAKVINIDYIVPDFN